MMEAEQLVSKSLPPDNYRHINSSKLSKNSNNKTSTARITHIYSDFLDALIHEKMLG